MRSDPWTAGGLALLFVLTLAVFLLYRSAPQSLAEARTGTLLAARPDAYAPRLARARERLRAGQEAAGRGEDSLAVVALREAAEHAARASEAAGDGAERGAAVEVWGTAVLEWAARVQAAGRGTGVRPDDEERLTLALRMVEQVLAASPPPAVRSRAAAMREELRRQLRTGPLEWLPLPR